MAAYKNLGLYWGEKSFIFVVSDNQLNSKLIRVSMNLDGSDQDFIPDDLHLTAILQRTIRESRIEAKNVNLAIPAGGTIIRAFVMPVMTSRELVTAIEYEAKKYIPFNLKDLAYVYHSIPIIENKIKKLRIIFVAIRKEVIERHTSVLKGLGLEVSSIEPASISIVRVLLARKIIHKNQSAAILNIVGDVCAMTFLNDGIVFFVREFQIIPPGTEKDPQQDQGLIKNRLLNEVHNSLDFYNRQYVQTSVNEMFVLSAKHNNPYETWLKDDLGIPVKFVDPLGLFGGNLVEQNEAGVLEALGASFAQIFKVKVDFNWSKKSSSRAFSSIPEFTIDLGEYLGDLKIIFVCVVLVVAASFFGKYFNTGVQVALDHAKADQSRYADLTQEDIQTRKDKILNKVTGFKKVRFKSSITPVYYYFAQLIPEGFWLTRFKLESVERKVVATQSLSENVPENVPDALENFSLELQVEGKVYLKDPNQAIHAINDLLSKVKKSKELAKYFKTFSLGDLKIENSDNHMVFLFSITGN